MDYLLDIPRLNGIEWGPDTYVNGGDEKWYPYYKKIQAKGKSVLVWGIQPKDIEKLLDNISPKGLFIATSCETEDEAKELLKKVEKWSVK